MSTSVLRNDPVSRKCRWKREGLGRVLGSDSCVHALHGDDQDVGRGDLCDAQWSVLESLLPAVGITHRFFWCLTVVG